MERFDWSEDLRVMVQWKSVSMVDGDQCVIKDGITNQQLLCADSLHIQQRVSINLFIEH